MKRFTQYITEQVSAEAEMKIKLTDAGIDENIVTKAIETFHTHQNNNFELYHQLRDLGLDGGVIPSCFPHLTQ